jgi:hypothetical protein
VRRGDGKRDVVHYYEIQTTFLETEKVEYWEIIADRLSKSGWNWGCVDVDNDAGRGNFVVPGNYAANRARFREHDLRRFGGGVSSSVAGASAPPHREKV